MAKVERTRNGGEWTEARFRSFVKSALRNASMRWPPKYQVKRNAWVRKGIYMCAGYNRRPHKIPAKDVVVDHINPVVEPTQGFVDWNTMIERMFCEAEGLQVLCPDCHQQKTNEEKQRKKNV